MADTGFEKVSVRPQGKIRGSIPEWVLEKENRDIAISLLEKNESFATVARRLKQERKVVIDKTGLLFLNSFITRNKGEEVAKSWFLQYLRTFSPLDETGNPMPVRIPRKGAGKELVPIPNEKTPTELFLESRDRQRSRNQTEVAKYLRTKGKRWAAKPAIQEMARDTLLDVMVKGYPRKTHRIKIEYGNLSVKNENEEIQMVPGASICIEVPVSSNSKNGESPDEGTFWGLAEVIRSEVENAESEFGQMLKRNLQPYGRLDVYVQYTAKRVRIGQRIVRQGPQEQAGI